MRRCLLNCFTLLLLGLIVGCSNSGGPPISGGGTGSPSALNGQYAFVLAGFDPNANPMGMAGSLKADGQGHITGGAVDVNDNGVVSSSSSLAGTYVINTDGLGTITLTNSITGLSHTLSFGFALQTSGVFGNLMSLDANNFIATGTIQQQASTSFSLSSLAGDYVIELNGRNATSPTSALGRFTLASGGTSTNVEFDRSVAGAGSSGALTGSSASVTMTPPDTNGRGALTVSINDGGPPLLGNITQDFIYYAVNSNRFIAVQSGTSGTMTVDASRQTLGGITVNTTGAVFGIAGIDTAASNEISAAGQMVISTSNNVTTASLAWDSNDNGTINTIPSGLVTSQPVTFDSTTGRGTISVTNGTTTGLANTVVFYLTAPGAGFVLDGTAGTGNFAMAGPLTAQTLTTFSASAAFPGLAVVRSRGSSVGDAQSFIGTFGPTGNSQFQFVSDQRAPSGGTIQTATHQFITNISLGNLNAIGRGTMLIPTGFGNASEAFYVIGPNQFVFLDISSVASGLNGPSPMFFASPQ